MGKLQSLEERQLKEKERRQRASRNAVTYVQRLRREVLVLLGGRCVRCGNDDWRVLEIDCLTGEPYWDGKSGNPMRKRYLLVKRKEGEGFQLLCANCHKIKDWEAREGDLDSTTVQ